MITLSQTLCTVVAAASLAALGGCATLGNKFPEPKRCAHYMELGIAGPHTPVDKIKTYHFCGDQELEYVKIENDFDHSTSECRAVARYYKNGHASPPQCTGGGDLNWEGATNAFHAICIRGMNSGYTLPNILSTHKYDVFYCEQPVRENHW